MHTRSAAPRFTLAPDAGEDLGSTSERVDFTWAFSEVMVEGLGFRLCFRFGMVSV